MERKRRFASDGRIEPPKAQGGSGALRRFAVVASFIAIGCGALFWLFFSGSVPKEARRWRRSKGKQIMDVVGAARPASASATASAPTGGLTSTEQRSVLPRTREDIAPPEPLADVVEKARPRNRLFKTSTEAYISMATPSAPGVGVPPVPIPADVDFSEDMKRAFSTPIMAEEGDDEETIGRKLAVLDAKNQLQELAEKEHWTLQQFVKAIRDKHIADGDYLAECHAAIERAYADPEISDTSYLGHSRQGQRNAPGLWTSGDYGGRRKGGRSRGFVGGCQTRSRNQATNSHRSRQRRTIHALVARL